MNLALNNSPQLNTALLTEILARQRATTRLILKLFAKDENEHLELIHFYMKACTEEYNDLWDTLYVDHGIIDVRELLKNPAAKVDSKG